MSDQRDGVAGKILRLWLEAVIFQSYPGRDSPLLSVASRPKLPFDPATLVTTMVVQISLLRQELQVYSHDPNTRPKRRSEERELD